MRHKPMPLAWLYQLSFYVAVLCWTLAVVMAIATNFQFALILFVLGLILLLLWEQGTRAYRVDENQTDVTA